MANGYGIPASWQRLGARFNLRGMADEEGRQIPVARPPIRPQAQEQLGAPPEQTGQSTGGAIGGSLGGAGGAIAGFFAGGGPASPLSGMIGAIIGGSLGGAGGTVAGQEAGAAITGEREEMERWQRKAYGPNAPKPDYSSQRAQPFIQAGAALPGQIAGAYATQLATQQAAPPTPPPTGLAPQTSMGGFAATHTGALPGEAALAANQGVLDLPPGVNLSQQAYLADQAGIPAQTLADAAQSDRFLVQDVQSGAIRLEGFERPLEPAGQFYEVEAPASAALNEGFVMQVPGGAPSRDEAFVDYWSKDPGGAYDWALGQAAAPGITERPAGMPQRYWDEYQGSLPQEDPLGSWRRPQAPPIGGTPMQSMGEIVEQPPVGLTGSIAPAEGPPMRMGGLRGWRARGGRGALPPQPTEQAGSMLFTEGAVGMRGAEAEVRSPALGMAKPGVRRVPQAAPPPLAGVEAPTGLAPASAGAPAAAPEALIEPIPEVLLEEVPEAASTLLQESVAAERIGAISDRLEKRWNEHQLRVNPDWVPTDVSEVPPDSLYNEWVIEAAQGYENVAKQGTVGERATAIMLAQGNYIDAGDVDSAVRVVELALSDVGLAEELIRKNPAWGHDVDAVSAVERYLDYIKLEHSPH